jgi:acetyl-CoA C-acetyltransferase
LVKCLDFTAIATAILRTAMKEAVIVSTARTAIGRAFKGSLNHVKSPTLTGHVIGHAVQRAGIEGSEVA